MSDSDEKAIKDDQLDDVSGGASSEPELKIGIGHGHLGDGEGQDPDIVIGGTLTTPHGKIPPG